MSGFWRFLRYGLLAIAALIAILIAAPFILVGADRLYYSVVQYTHHYRLVLEIEDHGEIHTGSSVIGVSFSPPPPWFRNFFPTSRTRVRGEAVVVELSTGQVVVATLMHGPKANASRMQSLASRALGSSVSGGLREAPNWAGKAELTGSDIPTMILLPSLDDPFEGSWLAPDEFPEKIGPNVRFRRMTLEMTSDPVTRQIEEKLPLITQDRGAGDVVIGADGQGIPLGIYLTR